MSQPDSPAPSGSLLRLDAPAHGCPGCLSGTPCVGTPGRSRKESYMDKRTFLGAGALLLAACGEAAVNSGDYVEVRFVNSTGLSNVVVTVRGGDASATWTFATPDDPPGVVGTGIQTAGQPVQFHVEAGEEITDHTCHVH